MLATCRWQYPTARRLPKWAHRRFPTTPFAQAVRESIEKAGLFSNVAADGARYRLTSFIGKVDQPTFGFSFTVKMEVSYALKDTKSGSIRQALTEMAALTL